MLEKCKEKLDHILKKNKVFTAGLGYLIGNILIKGIAFLTLPIFSRIMTTEEFGVYNVFLSYEAILCVIIGFALHSSIRSANLEFEGKIDEYFSSVSLIYILNGSVLIAAAVIFQRMVCEITGFSLSVLILLIAYSFGTAIISLYNNKISLAYAYKRYIFVALCNSLGSILVSLVLMYSVCKEHKDYGRIIGSSSVLLALAILILVSSYKKEFPKLNKDYWKFGLKYSMPIVPHGISQVLLAQFDRIMINNMVGTAQAGIYSLAGNIKLILTIITDSIANAWTTWFYEEAAKGNFATIRRRAIQLVGLFAIFTIGVIAMSPELIYILGGAKYELSRYIAIPMVVDAFVLFLYNVIIPCEYYKKKTVYVMYGTIVAAVLNVVLNYIFILKFGFIAAAYTTLASYIVYMIMHTMISYRLMGEYIISIKWMLLYIALIGAYAGFAIVYVNNTLLRYGVCVVLVLPMAVFLVKSYLKQESVK